MNAWVPNTASALNAPVTVGASQTDAPVSQEFAITAGGARSIVIAIKCTGHSGTVTAKLQSRLFQEAWVDSKTVSISGNGTFYIKLLAENSSDQAFLPLLSRGRIVITTAGASGVTVNQVYTIQEQ